MLLLASALCRCSVIMCKGTHGVGPCCSQALQLNQQPTRAVIVASRSASKGMGGLVLKGMPRSHSATLCHISCFYSTPAADAAEPAS